MESICRLATSLAPCAHGGTSGWLRACQGPLILGGHCGSNQVVGINSHNQQPPFAMPFPSVAPECQNCKHEWYRWPSICLLHGVGEWCCDAMPPHRLWERAHPAHGPHGHQGLVWAAIWPTLILWNQAQDQCSPHSSPHKGLIAMWPLHRVGPFTWPERGQSIVAVCPPPPTSSKNSLGWGGPRA